MMQIFGLEIVANYKLEAERVVISSLRRLLCSTVHALSKPSILHNGIHLESFEMPTMAPTTWTLPRDTHAILRYACA